MLLPSLSCEDYLHIITCSLALCIKAPSSGLEAMRPWINLGSGSPTSGRYTGAHGFTGHGQCFASSSGGTAWSCTALVARYARHNGHLTGTSSCFSDEHNPRNVFGVIVSWLCSKPGTTTNSVGVSGEARASGVASLTGFGGDEGFCGVWEIEVQRLAETAGDCATGKTACGSAYDSSTNGDRLENDESARRAATGSGQLGSSDCTQWSPSSQAWSPDAANAVVGAAEGWVETAGGIDAGRAPAAGGDWWWRSTPACILVASCLFC